MRWPNRPRRSQRSLGNASLFVGGCQSRLRSERCAVRGAMLVRDKRVDDIEVQMAPEAAEEVALGGEQGVTGEVHEDVPAKLQAKFLKLNRSAKWWMLVPKPFLALIVFCVGFAVLSLFIIGVMAASSSDDDDAVGSSVSDRPVEKPSSSSSFLLCVGVLSSVMGSLQTASGYCAQRLGHQLDALTRHLQHDPDADADEPTPRHPLFFIGLLLLVCGTIAAIVNLGILGQSVTAPFAAMTLIFNGCLAFTVLHEAVSKYDIIATILVLLGVGVAMLGVGLAHLDAQKFVLADIEEILTRSPFPALYSVIMLGSLVALYTVVHKRHLHNKPLGLCCFSVGAGVLSGFSSLCVKCTVEVLKGVTQQHSNDLSDPVLYVFVVGIPACVLSQLKLMTLGLQHFGTLKFVPPYHAFIILSNLVNGMVYFDEAAGYDALSALLFAVGCAVTIGGVFVLLAKVPSGDTCADAHEVMKKGPPRVGRPPADSTASETSGSEADSSKSPTAMGSSEALPPLL